MGRSICLLLIFVVGMLVAKTQVASAQTAYDYPWCARTRDKGSFSCYFTTREQCLATISGIGGLCVTNPYRPPAPTGPALRRQRDR